MGGLQIAAGAAELSQHGIKAALDHANVFSAPDQRTKSTDRA